MFNTLRKLLTLTVFIAFQCMLIQCNEKHELSIKNLTEIDAAKPKTVSHNDDPFRKDLRKYLRECGADVSGEVEDIPQPSPPPKNQNSDEEQSAEIISNRKKPRRQHFDSSNAKWGAYEQRKKGGNKGTYPSQYGKRKGGNRSEEYSDEDDSEDEDYRGGNKRKGGNNKRRGNRRNGNKRRPSSDDYDDSRDDCEDDRRGGFRKDQGGSKNPFGGGMGGGRGGSKGYYGYTSGIGGDPFGKPDYGIMYANSMPDMWSRTGYSTYGGRLMMMAPATVSGSREKRQVGGTDETCVSQCVFGYLEMLDDNRIPAETEVIKYFQNKISNSGERMRLIKLSRRCFAKLSTAGKPTKFENINETDAIPGCVSEIPENEDGCQFSKELARCLQIEIKKRVVV